MVLLPVLALIALAIKITSPGPVLFKQKRVGQNGKQFNFFKFRSMHVDNNDQKHRDYVKSLIKGEAEKHSNEGKSVYKLADDPRITGIGRILRTWSLDELPQLFNVVKGEMSLVGPRPAIPYEVENYESWHLERTKVLPGITGKWQVNGRSKTTFAEMVRMDIQYIRNWSWILDVKILLKTFGAVYNRDGAL
jgi:lipopolysaccharide/colanic/teichoic acid biosynthesis glycosyltransferase